MQFSAYTDINAPITTRLIAELADYIQRKLYPIAHDSISHTFKRIDSGDLQPTPHETYLYTYLALEAYRRGGYRAEHRRTTSRMAALRRSHPNITSLVREDVKLIAARINRPTASDVIIGKLRQFWKYITT